MYNTITFLHKIVFYVSRYANLIEVTERKYTNENPSCAVIINAFDFIALVHICSSCYFSLSANCIRCARENMLGVQKRRVKIQRGGYECTEFQSSQFILAHLQWHEVKHKRRLYRGERGERAVIGGVVSLPLFQRVQRGGERGMGAKWKKGLLAGYSACQEKLVKEILWPKLMNKDRCSILSLSD